MFKIFVGNLNVTTTEDAIRRLFSRHAEVDDVALPLDPETGKPRGFAIVMIKDELRAKGAMIALRGTRLDGRALVINQARKKGQAPPKRERRRGSRFRARGGGRSSNSFGPRASGGLSGPTSGNAGPSTGTPSPGYSSRPARNFSSRPDWRSASPPRDRDNRGSRPASPNPPPSPDDE